MIEGSQFVHIFFFWQKKAKAKKEKQRRIKKQASIGSGLPSNEADSLVEIVHHLRDSRSNTVKYERIPTILDA